MKVTNYGFNFNKKMTLRLTENEFNYLILCSNVYNTTPSDFLRKLIDSSMNSIENLNDERKNIDCHENNKMCIDN